MCSLSGSGGKLRCGQNTVVYKVFCLLLSRNNCGNCRVTVRKMWDPEVSF